MQRSTQAVTTKTPTISIPERYRRYLPVGTAILVYLLIVVFINPLREGAMRDDWAYALSVRNLLQTGVNMPYIWFPTYFPMHTYWGGLFSLLFGYSFAVLRVSTVALMLAGLAAFYGLARECGIGEWPAALLSVVLLANPLVMMLTFSFMSEIPLMVWLIIALACYARGARLKSIPWMALGSAAAAAATLTRFNGWAFLPALALTWLLDKDRKQSWRLWLAGAILPALAGVYMLYAMVFHPVQDTGQSLEYQTGYLSQIGSVLLEANWRTAGVLEYMAWAGLPLVLALALDAAIGLFRRRGEPATTQSKPVPAWLLAACLVTVGATLGYGYFGMKMPIVMPLFQGDASFYNWTGDFVPALTVITTIGAGVVLAVVVHRYFGDGGWRELPAGERLIDLVTLFLLASITLLFKIIDRYVLIIWPYALIVLGRYVWRRWGNGRMWAAALPVLAVMLVLVSMWTRWYIARNEARWNAGEDLLASGVPPTEITSYWEWNSYHGAYDLYVEQRKRVTATQSDYLFRWLPDHLWEAEYLVTPRAQDANPADWTVIETAPYEHWGFPERPILVFRRGQH